MTQIITILNIFIYSNSQDNNFFFYIEHRLKTIYVILKKKITLFRISHITESRIQLMTDKNVGLE
jgi:hypothetical protein